MTRKLLLFLTCLSLMAGVAMARTVRGVVIEAATDDPVPGATVKCKSNPSIVTATDVDGNFTLNVPDNEKTLVVSFIGMLTQDVAITSDNLTIFLEEAANNLDEVVVIGYGTTTKRKTTTSVSVVKASEIEAVPVPNVSSAMAGRAAGLIVQQSGGGIDATSAMSIRGGGTPLFVIDNIVSEQREFNNLNPSDIESISILKDAAGTAIYGQRAGNGIIIVTTKRGQSGKVNVDYSYNISLSGPADLPKKLGSYEGALYVNMGNIYDGLAPTYSDQELQLYRDGTNPDYPNVDWQKEVLRSYAPEQRHLLTITGGSERVKAYTALSYYDQQSIYRQNTLNYKRYNARTNINIDIKEIGLNITTGLEAYITNRRDPAIGYYGVWSHIQNKTPMNIARNPFGQPYSGTTDNPLLDISDKGGYTKADNTNVRGTIDATWMVPWVKGLSIVGRASYAALTVRSKVWSMRDGGYTWDGTPVTPTPPSLTKTANYYDYYTTQLFANYNRDFGMNNIELTLGVEANGSSYDTNSLARSQYVLDVDQIGAGPVGTQTNSASDGVQYRNASLIFRAHYDYGARYIAEFALRHDGADKFPKNHRWGTFFSGSLGWNVSEESFWKESQLSQVWNMFKIRGSIGEIGQDSGIGHYDYVSSYNMSSRGAFLGGTWYQTFSEGALPSPDISWYTQRDFNVGIDFALFQNAFSGSVDYFYKSTKGYLASPSNVGYTAPLGQSLPIVKSDGESRRRGVDFTLQYNGRAGDFSYQIGGNFTFYDERWNINPFESEASLKNPYTRSTQVDLNYYGSLYKNLGYFTGYEDILNSVWRVSSTNIMAGDLKYYDFNGDGKLDGNDQYRMGKGSSPQGNFGINLAGQYKGFYLTMLWQGATSYNLYAGTERMNGAGNGALQGLPVKYDYQTDIWTPDHTNSLYPRQHSSSSWTNINNGVGSDFWLINAQYIRLKNMTIGYDFKHMLLKKTKWLSKLNLSLTGYNLLTFSPAKKWGFDPETGSSDGYSYPVSRVYTFSVNIGF
ncbi:MAG: TonB-dependent receptor [Paramuribaculum sp.]|nr:TonB-dependent receptor [Paramuribaculum sp.]